MLFPLNPFGQRVFRTSKIQSYRRKGEKYFTSFPEKVPFQVSALSASRFFLRSSLNLMKVHQGFCHSINIYWGCLIPFLERKGRPLVKRPLGSGCGRDHPGDGSIGSQEELDACDVCTAGWKTPLFPGAGLYYGSVNSVILWPLGTKNYF